MYSDFNIMHEYTYIRMHPPYVYIYIYIQNRYKCILI